ncbi:hypothetical protein [Paenibacillus koleovorans]|uniref:hypothetical protein n=1 Tax=Paenibacillus koleovorans TaxID=121608 RepID=UPI0013E298A9|nr:hypothetical protein [Paenibacillus koleovorans]
MKFKVQVSVGQEVVKELWMEIVDDKLEELSEEEIEAAIEMKVRNWADREISLAWETE